MCLGDDDTYAQPISMILICIFELDPLLLGEG